MNLREFLKNNETDIYHRYISEIWSFNDEQIETTHNFIQFLFPLTQPSKNSLNKIYINSDDLLCELKSDKKVRESIIYSSNWYFSFLERNQHWQTYYDHNHLRISRVIESLNVIVSNRQANRFYKQVLDICIEELINDETKLIWKSKTY
tara:strand:- start:89 stop:535 length:447 start_codon:yes stop_codon:yes gene_type:complete